MNGGDGNDRYYVDNVSDIVAETYNDAIGGHDTVFSSVSYSLSPGTSSNQQGFGIENLELTGSAVSGTGNSNHNIMAGNNTSNVLRGLNGNDTLYGRDGNDTLWGGNGNDILYGDNGNDTLYGQSGDDILYGGAGGDKFHFNTKKNDGGGIDIIKGYDVPSTLNPADDQIILDGWAFDTGLQSVLVNNVQLLHPLWYFEVAGTPSDSALSGIHVDTTTGNIWYNPTRDTGDIYHFATVDPVTIVGGPASLSHADFEITAFLH